ncbi:MAG: hypothetical protein GXX79_11400 [Actinomycetales bacterium]|nr:hypothetical protein [Actinomycetales bacterium]
MSTMTRALLILQADGRAPCFYTPHGDPLFVLPHLADLVHHHDEYRALVDVDAYRAYTRAHPGALPETDLSTCTAPARTTGVTYTYRFQPPTRPLPPCPIPGVDPRRVHLGDVVPSGADPAGHGSGGHGADGDGSWDNDSGEDGLRLGITITGAREHPLLGALSSQISGRAGLYAAAARCCQALAADLAVHPARTRGRQAVEFLEPAWWHTHAETFTTWAQHATSATPRWSQSAAWRARRRRELLAAITIETSRRTVTESLDEITPVLPTGWTAGPVQQLPRATYAIEVTAPTQSADVRVRLIPAAHGTHWNVHIHDHRTGVASAVFDPHGHARTYPTPIAAAHAAITAMTIHTATSAAPARQGG